MYFIVNSEIRSGLKMWHILFQPLFSTWFGSRPYEQNSQDCSSILCANTGMLARDE